MDSETEFDELAGIQPGVTTIREIVERLGEADQELPSAVKAGVYLEFTTAGIGVFLTTSAESTSAESTSPPIDEVRLLKGNPLKLKCGLHLGMPRRDATELIRRLFTVTDEYEDAIYFVPSSTRSLGACAEFMGEDAVTELSLDVNETP